MNLHQAALLTAQDHLAEAAIHQVQARQAAILQEAVLQAAVLHHQVPGPPHHLAALQGEDVKGN